MGLEEYNRKRDFSRTDEPEGKVAKEGGHSFVVQKHDASTLHYDYRLEMDGVLVSWAVPKGPSLDPSIKRLAIRTEDHPISYGSFEGTIPEGEYGSGEVIVWDRGTYTPLNSMEEGLEKGLIKCELHGEKLKGGFALTRIDKDNWLLVKMTDAYADADLDILEEQPASVISGKTIGDEK